MAEKRKIITLSNINRRLFMIFVILLGVFFAAQVVATSKVGTKSAEIEAIRRDKDQLRLDIEILKAKIDEEKTTAKVTEIINNLGLTEKYVNKIEESQNEDLALYQ